MHHARRRCPAAALVPLAAVCLPLIAGLPARAQGEPARKGLGGLLGKAADRLKEEAMKRFDANGDGTLDEAEQAEALEAMKKKGGDLQAQLKQFMLRRFDADKDGTLDEKERTAALEELGKQLEKNGPMVKNTILGMVHKRFDADGDGRLEGKELEAARDELTKRLLQGAGGTGPQAPPDPALRRRQAEEARKKEMLDRFDADGDGRLDEAERAKAKEDLERLFDDFDAKVPAPAAK
ncbi:MAG: hypothetical protein ACKO3G_05170 [Planctomycetaceae bacterium]